MVYWSEVEQEPYDPEEFVERLAWRTTEKDSSKAVDDAALKLHDAFVEAIKDLTLMHEAQKKKCITLENVTNKYFINWT
jgi:exocyst complex component 5